jgi:hypothetical protein
VKNPWPDDQYLHDLSETMAQVAKQLSTNPDIVRAVANAQDAQNMFAPLVQALSTPWFQKFLADRQALISSLSTALPAAIERQQRFITDLAPAATDVLGDSAFITAVIKTTSDLAPADADAGQGASTALEPGDVVRYIQTQTDLGQQAPVGTFDLVQQALNQSETAEPGAPVQSDKAEDALARREQILATVAQVYLLLFFAALFILVFGLVEHILVARELVKMSREWSKTFASFAFRKGQSSATGEHDAAAPADTLAAPELPVPPGGNPTGLEQEPNQIP